MLKSTIICFVALYRKSYCRCGCLTESGHGKKKFNTAHTFVAHHVTKHMTEPEIKAALRSIIPPENFSSKHCTYCVKNGKQQSFATQAAAANHFIKNHSTEAVMKSLVEKVNMRFPEKDSDDEDDDETASVSSRISSVSGASAVSAYSTDDDRSHAMSVNSFSLATTAPMALPPNALSEADFYATTGQVDPLAYFMYLGICQRTAALPPNSVPVPASAPIAPEANIPSQNPLPAPNTYISRS